MRVDPDTLSAVATSYPYVWHWRGSWWRPVYRKGDRCQVVARGAMNSALIEFEDGFRVVASRNALRRARQHARREARKR